MARPLSGDSTTSVDPFVAGPMDSTHTDMQIVSPPVTSGTVSGTMTGTGTAASVGGTAGAGMLGALSRNSARTRTSGTSDSKVPWYYKLSTIILGLIALVVILALALGLGLGLGLKDSTTHKSAVLAGQGSASTVTSVASLTETVQTTVGGTTRFVPSIVTPSQSAGNATRTSVSIIGGGTVTIPNAAGATGSTVTRAITVVATSEPGTSIITRVVTTYTGTQTVGGGGGNAAGGTTTVFATYTSTISRAAGGSKKRAKRMEMIHEEDLDLQRRIILTTLPTSSPRPQ